VGRKHDPAQRLIQVAGRVAQVLQLPQRLTDLPNSHRHQTTTWAPHTLLPVRRQAATWTSHCRGRPEREDSTCHSHFRLAPRLADLEDRGLAGGGRLAAFLVDEIDELILKVNPVVLGAGTPLFGGLVGPRPVTLTGHKVYPNGFALMRYRWSP
jgi:riboflavin biosynthesis pyrimidine reductase